MPSTAKKKPIAIEDIAATTLTGDVRDYLMQWGKNLQKPWGAMSQREQELFRDACARQAETIIRQVTRLVGAQDHLSLEITTRDFNRKGERLEAKITLPYSLANLDALARASDAGPIVLSVVSIEQYCGERAPAKVMPDQPDLMDEDEEDAGRASDGPEAEAAAGDAVEDADGTVDHATGEMIDVAPEEGQRQGERRLLTYGGGAAQGAADQQPEAGDAIAAGHQADALADVGETGALSQAELDALSPEQRTNVERLQGVKTLGPGEADPIQEGPAPKKRRTKRTAEQRAADNAKAAEAGRML